MKIVISAYPSSIFSCGIFGKSGLSFTAVLPKKGANTHCTVAAELRELKELGLLKMNRIFLSLSKLAKDLNLLNLNHDLDTSLLLKLGKTLN